MNSQKSLILRAKKAYYEGKPIMSDAAFDVMYESFRQNFPDESLPTETLNDIDFKDPYLSLKKLSTKELINWVNGREIFIADKVDGVSMEITLSNGEIVEAITRGGKNRTNQVIEFLGKDYFGSNPIPYLRVRGELFISNSTFDRKFKESFSNARNLAAGAINSVKEMNVALKGSGDFVVWRVMDGLECNSHSERLRVISNYSGRDWSVKTTPPRFMSNTSTNSQDLIEFLKENEDGNKIRSITPYEVDGLVVFLDSVNSWDEDTDDNYHRNAVAWKFSSMKTRSTVREVVWSRGSSGNVTPVIKIDPVQLGGVIVKSINMFNYDNLMKYDIGIGSEVIVERAGDVIPHLYSNVTSKHKSVVKIEKPTNCPLCNSTLDSIGKLMKCTSGSCSGKWQHSLLKYASKMDVKFMSQEIFEGLEQCYHEQDKKFLHPLIWLLTSNKDDFHTFLTEGKLERFWSNFEESKRRLDQMKLISCMGVPSFSEKRFTPMFERLKVESLEDLSEKLQQPPEDFHSVLKPSEEAAMDYLRSNIDDFRQFVEFSKSHNLEGFSKKGESSFEVVVTGAVGSLKRKELKDLLASNGIALKDNVNSQTKFLISDDANSSSSKTKKAKSLGVTIISWKDFSESQLNG